MSESDSSLRETLLRQCLAADPGPWYPRDYSASFGLDLETFYGPLNDLRQSLLVQLTEWITGKGQGYTITPLGKEVLGDPLFLVQLREGKTTAPATKASEPAARDTATRFDIGEAARAAFFYRGQVRVTPIIIFLNLIAFGFSLAVAIRSGVPVMKFLGGGDGESMQKVGAITAGDLAQGEWWRLLANCFLHFGLLHLALNMFSLSLLRRVEALWGSGRFLLLYFTCGLCGSCAGVYYFPGALVNIVYLAGASGALWGVMASEAMWIVLNRSHLPPEEVRRWNQQLFFTLLLNVGVSMLPNVSAAAHVGGGVAGVLSALFLHMHRYGTPGRRALACFGLAMVPTAFLFGLALAFDKDPRLQPFVMSAYRDEIDPRVGKLPAKLDELEVQAERLQLQESAKRDAAQLAKVRENLQGLVGNAKDELKWVKKSTASTPARALRERGQALVEALISYAEALEKYAGGERVPKIDELRNNWQDARRDWARLAAK